MRQPLWKVVPGRPKLWWLLKLVFPELRARQKTHDINLAFGDTIYCSKPLNDAQLAHEEVHLRQHHYSKVFAFFYAIAFRLSPRFRLRSELEAYRVELKAAGPTHINEIAAKLASPLYGNLLSIEEARRVLANDDQAL